MPVPTSARALARLATSLAALALLAPSPLAAAPTDVPASTQAVSSTLGGSYAAIPDDLAPPEDASVRRWEYVLLVRTAPEVPGALGRAELAAQHAGAVVLESMRWDRSASHVDHRLLVRVRDTGRIDPVLRAMRATAGVLGATEVLLPETPTYAGGPSFFESYRSPDDDAPSNADRVVVRHDVPPIADKRELLEMTDVIAPPSAGPDGAGGFTLNVSELFARMKEGAWRRREERLRNTPIEILPPDGTSAAPPAPQP